MLDRFTSMRIFVAIARRGSFAEGAEEIGVSRAMASKHIKALESHLGVRLLNRTTRSIGLTEVGQIYLERIGVLLEQLETIEQQATNQSVEPKGNLAIAAPTSFGAFHLAPVVAAYMTKYPDINIRLTLTDRNVDLIDEGFDLAVRVGELEDSSHIARRLGMVRMVVCAAPDYLARHGEPQQPSDLERYNCLIFSETGIKAKTEWPFTIGGRAMSISARGDLVSNRGDALRVAAMAGRGIVRLPDYMVEEVLGNGDLIAVLTDFEPPRKPIYAVYLHREMLPSKIRTFVDYAATALEPQRSR